MADISGTLTLTIFHYCTRNIDIHLIIIFSRLRWGLLPADADGRDPHCRKTVPSLVHLPQTEGALEEFFEGSSLAIIWNFIVGLIIVCLLTVNMLLVNTLMGCCSQRDCL